MERKSTPDIVLDLTAGVPVELSTTTNTPISSSIPKNNVVNNEIGLISPGAGFMRNAPKNTPIPTTPTPTPAQPSNLSGKKRSVESTSPAAHARTTSAPTQRSRATPKKAEKPHVLIWICHHGHGDRGWKMKNPKVLGVYRTKQEAEERKEQIMMKYQRCGHGDILVGGTWEDEIDILVRPAEECTL